MRIQQCNNLNSINKEKTNALEKKHFSVRVRKGMKHIIVLKFMVLWMFNSETIIRIDSEHMFIFSTFGM